MRKIRKIEPTVPNIPKRKRVAAYARVSMETDRLSHSLSAQISYYSDLIQKNPEWEYAGVYADSFVSGTGTEKRSEFQRLIADCDAGRIDIVLCKSISRFARNTLDLLETVRHLKELGIAVHFEKENINSLSGDGELMLTILASFAQEESRSISDNVKWGIRKRFENGVPCGRPAVFGYEWVDDKLVIVPEEAAVVRRIFQNFLDGKSRLETERELNGEGITTKGGGRWMDSNIRVILQNITYTGNLLLQKEFIDDPISKHRRKNRGELPQYFVENTHEAIIDMETFQWVQAEMQRRRELGALANKSLNTCCFTGKIKCPFCDISYMHNTRTDRGFAEFWSCGSTKLKGRRCPVGGSINHEHLKERCAAVLGLPEFDETAFLDRVDVILVPARETLEFHLKDGTVTTVECRNTGHQDCWTAERRAETARKRRNSPPVNRPDMTCFSKKIKCIRCDCNYRKATSSKADGSKVSHWRCAEHKGCAAVSLRDDLLRDMTARVLGNETLDEAAFEQQVERIEVDGDMVTFCFRDGHTVTEQWIPPKKEGHKWTEAQRAKTRASIQASWTPERRAAQSERSKEMRRREKLAKDHKNSCDDQQVHGDTD